MKVFKALSLVCLIATKLHAFCTIAQVDLDFGGILSSQLVVYYCEESDQAVVELLPSFQSINLVDEDRQLVKDIYRWVKDLDLTKELITSNEVDSKLRASIAGQYEMDPDHLGPIKIRMVGYKDAQHPFVIAQQEVGADHVAHLTNIASDDVVDLVLTLISLYKNVLDRLFLLEGGDLALLM